MEKGFVMCAEEAAGNQQMKTLINKGIAQWKT